MYGQIVKHSVKEIEQALGNNYANVYWRNTLVNTNWRITGVRKRSFNLQVKVVHPIHAGWYVVDANDVITLQ